MPAPRSGGMDPELLAADLKAPGDAAEPKRIGAAYLLAAHEDRAQCLAILTVGLGDERESVRRAAGFGLIAMGDDATECLLAACTSPRKWLRKAGVLGLGDAATVTARITDAVVERLATDQSVYVRSSAAHAAGCLARRAIASGNGVEQLPNLVHALLAALEVEQNRLGMDQAQGRSIKFVRPTDDCDVCEGIGIDYGVDRFEPARSAVRENAMAALVILSSHSHALPDEVVTKLGDRLATIAQTEVNVFVVGLALDGLTRLAHTAAQEAQASLLELLSQARASTPILCQESLLRAAGVDR